ncbi:MAG: IPT/TIG domain-containing protein [Anaerolineae bacterium]|nr:IPT/TIG domain-containing protein [Anaerolineae bacterium]
MSIQEVRPGDLITASSWNLLVEKILELETKVDQLSAAGVGVSPVITQILPLSPPAVWRAGDAIEIHGQNFGYSRGAQHVAFDGVLVTAFKDGSSDTRLLIDIPPLPALSETGQTVTLVVGNGFGSTSQQMFIRPVDIPITGAVIDVFWDSVTPNPITPGVPVFIGYRLRSRAPVTATFTISPQVLAPSGIGTPQVFNSLTQENTSRQIQLSTMEEKPFFVRIPSLPSGITTFELEVEATAGSAVGSDAREFPLNTPIILPDSTIDLTPLNLEAIDPSTALPDPAGGSYDHASQTIQVRQDRSGLMSLRAEFQETGTYVFEVGAIGSLNGWDVELSETPSTVTIEPADFSGGASEAAETAKFFVNPPSSGTASAEIEFRVFRSGSTQGQARRFDLELQS